MATELGQAYVQIMPSAKGISGAITKELSGEATSAGKSAGGSIMGGIKGAIVKAGIGVAIAKTITDSIKAGGALQQSIGGIETLFKDNADTVKKYANEAYKTAGLSANAYMENVTSFSASLLQSLGGDTEKAAEKANTAMIDMSDNANKMGTDMRDIQNAYQGFAKQNYTMLDNLKLGYSGTKGEMERLLADATKLTGVKYDINNLSDVYDAIHVVQTELGITGATALESAETLSGSFASMKSSFTNFLGNLSLGEDVAPSLTALAETVSTFLFDNFLPMVGNIFKALPESIITFIQVAAPKVIEAGGELIGQLTTGITEGLPNLLMALHTMQINAMATITEKLPAFLEKGVEIIKNIADGILQAIPKIIESAGKVNAKFIEFIMKNFPKILSTGKDLILKLVDGIINNLPAIANSAVQAVSKFIDVIVKNYPEYLKTGWKITIELIAGIIEKLPDLIIAAGTLIAKFVAMIISKLPDIIAAGKDILGSIVSGIGQVAINLYNKGTELMNELVAKIKEKITDFLNAGKDIVEGLWNGITEKAQWLKDKVSGFIEGIKERFTSKDGFDMNSPSKLSESWGKFIDEGLANGIENNAYKPLNAMSAIVDGISSYVQDGIDWIDELANKIANFDAQSDTDRLTSASNAKKKTDNIYNTNKDAINRISKDLGVDIGVATEMFKRMKGYAVGTPFVTEDQVALIHKGEAIIPAKYNPYNKNSGEFLRQGDTTINIYNPQPSPSALARQIKKAQQELALGF